MQLLHQSRLAEFREPFGAVPAGTAIHLTMQVRPEGQKIRSANLCYAYGLKHFDESHCRLQAAAADPAADLLSFEVSLRMPGEACLVWYWLGIGTELVRLRYTADRENSLGR